MLDELFEVLVLKSYGQLKQRILISSEYSIRDNSVFHMSGLEIAISISYCINCHIFFVNKIDKTITIQYERWMFCDIFHSHLLL